MPRSRPERPATPTIYDCRGHVEKGAADEVEPTLLQVKYVFACSGPITGYQIQPDHAVQGMDIDEKLCDEPRVDPLLTVVYATADKTGKVTQAISGPYDLGRPRGCPKSARNGKWRIPHESEESTIQ